MKQNDKYLAEGLDILKREFGQPLPTLQDTINAHQAKKLQENPAAIASATAAMVQMKSKNPKTGRLNKLITTLSNKKAQAKSMGISVGESITEGPEDVRFARRALSKIVKTEQKFRKEMYELEQTFLIDPREENQTLAKEIKKSYKSGVTKFMRDSVLMVKRMK